MSAVAGVTATTPLRGIRPVFVVGCPRSGTTLVRVMLDGLPGLAVPPETHWVVGLRPRRFAPRPVTVDDVLAHHRFEFWALDPAVVREAVAADPPTTYPELIDRVAGTYARHHGKPRWGDKTPGYLGHMPQLLAMFPEARFIHVIRDGRQVAVSLSERPWGPRSAVVGAYWWRRKVRRGRRAGRALGPERYREVRLEDLIADPEGELRKLADYIGEPYDPAMLDYPERVLRRTQGAATKHLHKPPTTGLRDWERDLPARDVAVIEAVCAPLLRELGYDAGSTGPLRVRARGLLERVRAGVATGRADVAARLRPTSRAY